MPVNKNDSQFVNVFSLVIGLLMAVALALLFLARQVAARTEARDVYADPAYVDSVLERVAPAGQEAVAGQDNSALAIKAPAGAAANALRSLADAYLEKPVPADRLIAAVTAIR